MNLFPNEPRKTKDDIYHQQREKKLTDQWNEHVRIRMDVREWLSNNDFTPQIKQIADEILMHRKPRYELTEKLFKTFKKLTLP